MPDWRAIVQGRLEPLSLGPLVTLDIADELATHLEARYEELLARGASPEEAMRSIEQEHLAGDALTTALRSTIARAQLDLPVLGAARPAGWWRGLGSDVRYALRSLKKSPSLTLIVLATLTLGIGANVAIFSVVNALLLRPLPFPRPEQLVAFWGTAPEKGLPVVSYPDAYYATFRDRLRSLESVGMYAPGGFTMTGSGAAERVTGAYVTADLFRVLGIVPVAGRAFEREENSHGKGDVVVVSQRLLDRRFGGDARLIGKSLMLDGRTMTVVGIMPRGFDFPARAEIWLPSPIDPQSLDCWCYQAIGRLRPGATAATVARSIDALAEAFWAEREPGVARPGRNPDDPPRTVVVPLGRKLMGEVRTPVLLLLGAVAMVLLIACANLANLALARGAARRREIAVRSALGASPRRIARQLLAESLALSVGGGMIGSLLAAVAVEAVGRRAASHGGPLAEVGVDFAVLGFGLGLAIGTGLLFGLLPARRAARLELADALRDGLRGTGDRANRRLNDGFVVAQLALSLMLLVGAGLLLRSFGKLLTVDLGFRADKVVVGRLWLPRTLYRERDVRLFTGRLLERVAVLPGVTAAAVTSTAPFTPSNNQQEVYVEGQEPARNEPVPVASVRMVSPAYFDAVGTDIVNGRAFGPTDRDSSERVAIIDESLARRYWSDRSPIGARVGLTRNNRVWLTVVGVARAIRHGAIDGQIDHYVYLPATQVASNEMDLVVRAGTGAGPVSNAMRQAVQSLDPHVPLYDVHTLTEAVDRSLGTRRATTTLLLGFAAVALLLAAIGIYGVMSRNVAARIREFGVRLALGATGGEVHRLVLGHGARLVVLGGAIGLLGAMMIARLIRGLLFGVAPFDPLTFGAAVVTLALVAWLACYWPARRATRADPLEALRSE